MNTVEKPREVREYRRVLPHEVEAFKRDGWVVVGGHRFAVDQVNVLMMRGVTSDGVAKPQQRRFLENHVTDLRRVAWLLDDAALYDACIKLSRACYGAGASNEAHDLEAVVLVKRVRA